MTFRVHDWQIDQLAAALGVDPIGRVETYLRANYPEQCALYEPPALRAWIAEAVREVTARGVVSSADVLLQISMRWVLRAWFGEPVAAQGAAP